MLRSVGLVGGILNTLVERSETFFHVLDVIDHPFQIIAVRIAGNIRIIFRCVCHVFASLVIHKQIKLCMEIICDIVDYIEPGNNIQLRVEHLL